MKATGRVLAALLAIVLLLPAVTAFAAAQPTAIMGRGMLHFVVDGTEYAPPEGVIGGFFYKANYTYVPLRFVANIMRKEVNWDNKQKIVSIDNPGAGRLAAIEADLEALKVEPSVIGPAETAKTETLMIEVVPNVRYRFYDQEVQPNENTPGLMINNSIYVPLRFVVENLGYRVDWDKGTYTVSIRVAEVDEIVQKYRDEANARIDGLYQEADDLLAEYGLTRADVVARNVDEVTMGLLREKVNERLPEVERELESFVEQMKSDLEALNQPTLQADVLHDELTSKIFVTKNLLKTLLGL